MKLKFTKAEIIKAIKTEPLERGFYFYTIGNNKFQSCKVCAVGAVIRTKLSQIVKKNLNPSGVCSSLTKCQGSESPDQIPRLLEEKNYFGALSSYFENVTTNKTKLIDFVNENFPKTITVEI